MCEELPYQVIYTLAVSQAAYVIIRSLQKWL